MKTLVLCWALTLGLFSLSAAQAAPPSATELGTSAYQFDISQVSLNPGRFQENQARTVTYLQWVNPDSLLYVFRQNHGLSTQGATPNGGWDAPDFPFRSHMQGHFLSAWAQCYSQLRDATCQKQAIYFVQELAKVQANNGAVDFNDGFLAGFPESDFDKLENGTLTNGNVPYYVIHKTMAGLLDVWRTFGDETARDVLLSLADWVDTRTAKLSYDQMQKVMQTEFGGMNEVLADVYHQTSDKRWITTAARFDHAAVESPLAADQDSLNGLHANTQVPKWIGAVRQYKATGDERYLTIARNAHNITVSSHSYSIGGNSQAEHFHAPNAIAEYLDNDTAESCNSYNMLKLTRELWTVDQDAAYFDFYERTLLNHLLGQQLPTSPHGHVTYFTPLNPSGRRGVGPAWGGGTGLETHTKLMDSIYAHSDKDLFVNLFAPSTLHWNDVTVTQDTTFPVSDSSSIKVDGSGDFAMNIRVPSWTSNAEITVNDQQVSGTVAPGSYARISRTWAPGDTVNVRLPMRLFTVPANDDPSVQALHFGPVTLSGNYGDDALSAVPGLALDSVQRTSNDTLEFTGSADGRDVTLSPFYDAHEINYNVYWKMSGALAA
ncbi:MAG: hypothetical protein Q9159_006343 [Coniocarpon cinnabarinum]